MCETERRTTNAGYICQKNFILCRFAHGVEPRLGLLTSRPGLLPSFASLLISRDLLKQLLSSSLFRRHCALAMARGTFFTDLDSARQEISVLRIQLIFVAVVAQRRIHHHRRRRRVFSRGAHSGSSLSSTPISPVPPHRSHVSPFLTPVPWPLWAFRSSGGFHGPYSFVGPDDPSLRTSGVIDTTFSIAGQIRSMSIRALSSPTLYS